MRSQSLELLVRATGPLAAARPLICAAKEALGREAFRSSKSEIPDPSAGPRMIHDAAMM